MQKMKDITRILRIHFVNFKMTFDKVIYNAGVFVLYLFNSDPPFPPDDNEGIDYYLISIIIISTT